MGDVMVLNYLCHAMAGAKLSYSYLHVQMSATGYISQKLKRFVWLICAVLPGWLSFHKVLSIVLELVLIGILIPQEDKLSKRIPPLNWVLYVKSYGEYELSP